MGAIFIQSEPSVPAGNTEASAGAPGASEYANGVFERQPFRDYELSAVVAGDDRRAVLKGRDKVLDRPVAVKVMRTWRDREGLVEEFFSLAGSIARLKCPGVARGLDAGRSDDDFYLVYEYLPGESLEHKLQRRQSRRLTEKEAVKLVAEIAGILQNLFDKGNSHGNLKPSNIIVADGGAPRLADIGFAWNLAWPTDEAAFAAHPDYLPPERTAGELNVDVRGDLYSLGAIWFRAVLGRPVFLGDTPAETVRLHREEKAPALGSIDPKISAATSQLVRWLLEKNRDDRPRTPREFLKKLSEHPLVVEAAKPADAEDDSELPDEFDAPATNDAVGEEQTALF